METMNVIGVRTDGSAEVIGTAPVSPAIKRREIVRDYFGNSSSEGDESDMCLWALEQYHEFLVSQGWTALPLTITPKPAAEPATEKEE